METELLTGKIRLKPLNRNDAENLFRLRTNPIVNRYITRKIPADIQEVEQYIDNIISKPESCYFYTIHTHPENTFAGKICLWNIDHQRKYAEVGYDLLPEFHKQGLMSEAMAAITTLAFNELGFELLEAYTHRDNTASRRLLEKSGFLLLPGKTDPDNTNNVIYELGAAFYNAR